VHLSATAGCKRISYRIAQQFRRPITSISPFISMFWACGVKDVTRKYPRENDPKRERLPGLAGAPINRSVVNVARNCGIHSHDQLRGEISREYRWRRERNSRLTFSEENGGFRRLLTVEQLFWKCRTRQPYSDCLKPGPMRAQFSHSRTAGAAVASEQLSALGNRWTCRSL
jgi:hypothetical protein